MTERLSHFIEKHLVRDNENYFFFVRNASVSLMEEFCGLKWPTFTYVFKFQLLLVIEKSKLNLLFTTIHSFTFFTKLAIIFLISDAITKLQFTRKSCIPGKQMEKKIIVVKNILLFRSLQCNLSNRNQKHHSEIFYISVFISTFFPSYNCSPVVAFTFFFCFMCSV